MALDWLFRIHALSALAFAIPLLFAPVWLAGVLSPGQPVGEVAIIFERLYGLSCGLIAALAWGGSLLPAGPGRRFVAWTLFATESCGILVGLSFPTDPAFETARLLTLGSYAAFATAYLTLLVLVPRSSDRTRPEF